MKKNTLKPFPHLIHGGDYNPDQWMNTPEVWDEDMRFMKAANINSSTIGIFSWTALEPEEGHFAFDWLDRIMDKLAQNNISAILGTPSGAKPVWMSYKYPEICRVTRDGNREKHKERHNHCWTSPVYREKVRTINTRLAQRYKDHPALTMWHLSNEYSGDCYCELCIGAFRQWLQKKYGTLDALNQAWWTGFWNHTFTDWNQILLNDFSIHGLNLDWRRFTTDRLVDFIKNECGPLREFTPEIPVTTNLLTIMCYTGLDYWKVAKELDIVSWDNYPSYYDRPETLREARSVSFSHDLHRSFKNGRPFLMMESSPSATNWQSPAKLKKPGILRLISLQAIAHGSDSVQYFQWRAGRGGCEKFHGAAIAHNGTGDTRVYGEVAEVGAILKKLDAVAGTSVNAQVAVVYDWENNWAIDSCQALYADKKDYIGECVRHYSSFWQLGIPVDIVNMECDFSRYNVLIAPMLYMVRPGVAQRIEAFVKNGGIFVTTFWSGIVDENDLCFTGGRPGPLRRLLGIRSEEIDVLFDDEKNTAVFEKNNSSGIAGSFDCRTFCDLVHTEGAETLAVYSQDFYAGRPAVTKNIFGAGAAYYVAFRGDEPFLGAFYAPIIRDAALRRTIDAALPRGVTAQMRTDGKRKFVFVLNFTHDEQKIDLGKQAFTDMMTGEKVTGTLNLKGFEAVVLEEIR